MRASEEERSREVIVESISGLANRLRVIDATLVFQRESGLRCRVLWYRSPELNAPFHRLFEPVEGLRVIDMPARARPGPRTGRWRERLLLALHGISPRHRWHVLDVDREIRRTDYDLPLHGTVGPATWLVTCYRFHPSAPDYAWLRPRLFIRRAVEQLRASWPAGRMVGVHVRQGDHLAARQGASLEDYMRAMEQQLCEGVTGFFLATDSNNAEGILLQHFGPELVHVRTKTSLDRDDPQGIRDALVDLYGLASCGVVLGSTASSFGTLAAHIGGVPFVPVGTDVHAARGARYHMLT
jgi:hypothetical protein